MKNTMLLLISLLFITTSYGQDKTVDLSSFTSIDVSAGIEVQLLPGNPHADITMTKGDIEDLIIEQNGKSINIEYKKKKMGWGSSNNRKATIKLYFDMDISDVEVSSGASVSCNEAMKVDNVEAEASSGGSISMEVKSEDTDVEVSSGGSITIEGVTEDLSVEVSSGGRFSGKKLKADNVEAEASSGGSATVWASNEIVASTSSGGSVKYKGDPKKENIDAGKWSGGSIRKM